MQQATRTLLSLPLLLITYFLSTTVFAAHHKTGHAYNPTVKSDLVNIKSNHNVQKTADKLETILKEKGMTVFTRINHTAGAEKVGEKLRPTEVVIFGNPKVGTPLMQCAQTVAIDLPQKMLIWQDAAGVTWLTYNNPSYLAKRHKIKGCDPVIKKVTGALNKFANAAAK